MQQGRKPQPTTLKVLAGNPGHRPLNDSEPVAPLVRPDPPDHLDQVAQTEWDRICDLLYQMGLLSSADRTVIAAYCIFYRRWVEAERMVQKSGTVVKSPKQGIPMLSPYLAVANRAAEQMIKLCVELGLTSQGLEGGQPKLRDHARCRADGRRLSGSGSVAAQGECLPPLPAQPVGRAC